MQDWIIVVLPLSKHTYLGTSICACGASVGQAHESLWNNLVKLGKSMYVWLVSTPCYLRGNTSHSGIFVVHLATMLRLLGVQSTRLYSPPPK